MDIKGVYDVYQLHTTQGAGRSTKRTAEESAVSALATAKGVDVIQISPKASLRAKLDAMAKTQVQAEQGLSNQRLAELRQKYQGDSCPVSGADVAQALMDRIGGMALETRVAQ